MVEIKKYKKKKEWKDHVKVCDRIMYEDRVEKKKKIFGKKSQRFFHFCNLSIPSISLSFEINFILMKKSTEIIQFPKKWKRNVY